MASRDIMKGRHAVGGKLASPGKIRGGGSEPASNKFTTRNKFVRSSKSPFVPNAKDTSKAVQDSIKEPQAPFKNKLTAAQVPVKSGPSGGISTMEPKILSGMKRSNIGTKAQPGGAATGYSKLPDQSKQIGGRQGWPPPARKAGDNGKGFKSKKHAAFYGDN